jgi:hypothetical protein
MGRSRTWTYRVEWTVQGQAWTHTEWACRSRHGGPRLGAPNDRKLAHLVEDVVASFGPDGPNRKAGLQFGLPVVLAARVVDQRTGEVVAEYIRVAADRRPLFQTI